MRSILGFLAALIAGAFALWLAIAFLTGPGEYLALIRSGFLLLGLAGIAWGLLRRRGDTFGLGLGLILIGFASHWFLSASLPSGEISRFLWRMGRTFRAPIAHGISLGHIFAAALVMGNALMIHRRLGMYRIVTGNLMLMATAIVIAIFLGR